MLQGVHFDDAIANGSYRVDVHAPEGGGFLFKYLEGRRSSPMPTAIRKGVGASRRQRTRPITRCPTVASITGR